MTPLILLPPSEGKAAGGRGAPWSDRPFAIDLTEARQEVLEALATAMRSPEAQRAKLLGVKGTALDDATAANRAAAAGRTRPAIERYTGVLYDALDAASLGATERRRLNRSVLILSGLWGVVAPGDRIPDYKLKMGATLPALGVLSTWWRPAVSPALDERAAGRTTWNLLPGEHANAWSATGPTRQIAVRFLDEVRRPSGAVELATVSHWNKLLKGALVRWILATGADRPGDLASFTHPLAYGYDPSLDVTRGDLTTVNLIKRLA